MNELKIYKRFVDFLSLFLGSDTEVILSDADEIIYIRNPFDNRKAGMPIGDMERSFIETGKYLENDYIVNYRSLSPNGDKLRSATMFINGGNNVLEGLITINTSVKELLFVRDLVDLLINGEQQVFDDITDSEGKSSKSSPHYYETFSDPSFTSVMDMSKSMADQCINKYGVPPDRLTTDEKLKIVRELDDMGLFLLKGSVSEVAKKLESSEATIYRYLQQINS